MGFAALNISDLLSTCSIFSAVADQFVFCVSAHQHGVAEERIQALLSIYAEDKIKCLSVASYGIIVVVLCVHKIDA